MEPEYKTGRCQPREIRVGPRPFPRALVTILSLRSESVFGFPVVYGRTQQTLLPPRPAEKVTAVRASGHHGERKPRPATTVPRDEPFLSEPQAPAISFWGIF